MEKEYSDADSSPTFRKGSSQQGDKYHGKWVLRDKQNKVIYSNKCLSKVVKKGKEYPKDEVIIEKYILQRTCFF